MLDILELLMEYGLDGINLLEPHLNEAGEFVRLTQGRLLLYGGLDNAEIIPHDTPEQVREHVLRQFGILGAKGGLIFSSHDIPAGCPRENLDALVSAIKTCRYVK